MYSRWHIAHTGFCPMQTVYMPRICRQLQRVSEADNLVFDHFAVAYKHICWWGVGFWAQNCNVVVSATEGSMAGSLRISAHLANDVQHCDEKDETQAHDDDDNLKGEGSSVKNELGNANNGVASSGAHWLYYSFTGVRFHAIDHARQE